MDANTVRQIEQLPRGRIGDAWREALVLNPSRFVAEFLRRKYYSKPTVARGETASQDPNIEVQIPANLQDDLLYQIFMLLPAESLFRLKFVCKQWFCLINSSIFVTSHAQKSETVLISQQMASFPGYQPKRKVYFRFLSLHDLSSSFVEASVDDLDRVRASYDGLIITTNVRRKILKLMNPMTGRYVDLPLGVSYYPQDESFGIAFCSEAKTYKVVHLFPGRFGCFDCEILTVETRKWRRMEGSPLPLRKEETMLSASGSLDLLGDNCFFSLDVRDEKFVIKKLPVKMGWNDMLVEIAGGLGFVNRVEVNALEVWVLSELGGECWIKRCRINLRADLEHSQCSP